MFVAGGVNFPLVFLLTKMVELLREAAKKVFFRGLATKRGRGKGRATRKNLCYLFCLGIDYIGSSHKSDFFPPKNTIFLHACATCSELPSNVSIMYETFRIKY